MHFLAALLLCTMVASSSDRASAEVYQIGATGQEVGSPLHARVWPSDMQEHDWLVPWQFRGTLEVSAHQGVSQEATERTAPRVVLCFLRFLRCGRRDRATPQSSGRSFGSSVRSAVFAPARRYSFPDQVEPDAPSRASGSGGAGTHPPRFDGGDLGE